MVSLAVDFVTGHNYDQLHLHAVDCKMCSQSTYDHGMSGILFTASVDLVEWYVAKRAGSS